MKKALIVIGSIVGVVAIALGIMFATGTIKKWTADWRGEVSQIEDTKANSDYRIANYDMFFDSCSAIQADEDRIANIEDGDSAQKDTTLTAIKNSRAEKIRQYNADAAKEATAGQFRDSGLPHEISMEGETTCHVN